jgi:predicted acetyltransferase
MIERQLALSRERGEPASALLASEAGIYGRFGYGPSTWSVGFTIPVAFSAFRAPLRDSVQCRLVDAVEAAVVLPRVFDRHCSMRHGSLGRTAGLWHVLLADPEHHREGAGPLFHVAHEEAGGDLDGYATTVMDFLWLRILDVSACLAARDYAAEGALVLEAHEPNSTSADTPGSDGGPASRRYLLDAGPDGAVCGPTARPADVVLGVAELGAVYLGGTSFTSLAQGGRVHEAASGALAKADKLFATALAPWCCTSF